jgi:hypothetical protein
VNEMKDLLIKEYKLAMHPTSIIFLSFVAMVMIPNYPYEVNYFYTTLGIFFICLTGRENKDIYYSMLLPICKKDIVKARFLLICSIELLQLFLTVPFVLLKMALGSMPNQVGMDANVAFFGIGFLLFGIFNLCFLTGYYKDVNQVGRAFGISSILVFVYIVIEIILMHAIPFLRDYADTPDPKYMGSKIAILLAGVLLYLIFTFVAYKKSVRTFDTFDL